MIDLTFFYQSHIGTDLTTFTRERHNVDHYSVLFRYCSLGVDTAMHGGLHARLGHAFSVRVLIHVNAPS